jgi:hypothetical protein
MATFKDIEKANSTIRTTNIKGKDYAEVNQRIKAFRMLYPDGYIRTEIIESDLDAGLVMMQAVVGYYDENGIDRILGTGTSFEWKNDPKSMVNKTSFIENCETSAVGRALGMIGLGVDVAIASAEEVKFAVQHQEEMKKAPVQKDIICQRCGVVIGTHGKSTAQQIAAATKKQFGKVMCWECGHITKEEQEKANLLPTDAEVELPFEIKD